MYADDLLLLSASVSGLQSMLDICYLYGLNNSIVFNYAKSVCLKIGLNWHRQISQMFLGTRKLEWVTSVKYMGMMFNSGRASCNGILAHCKNVDEFVKLSLIRAYCLPILLYCVVALDMLRYQVKDLAVCWNDCFQ